MLGWCDGCGFYDQKECGRKDCPEKIGGVLPQYSRDTREAMGLPEPEPVFALQQETITAEEEARYDAQADYLDSSISKDRPYPPMYV